MLKVTATYNIQTPMASLSLKKHYWSYGKNVAIIAE